MIIDMHIHPFCKEATVLPNYNEASKRLYGAMADKERFKNITAALMYFFTQKSISDIISEMDEAGIDKAVIVSADYTTASGVVAVTNQDVSRFAGQYPDRFIPFAGIDPSQGRAAVDTLIHAVDVLGCRGIKLVPPMQHFTISNPKFNPLWEAAIERDIIVWTHTAHQLSTPGSNAILGHPMLVDAVALRYPEMKIVMGHCGIPWPLDAWSVALRHTNVYIDISAYSNLYNYFPWDAYAKYNIEHKVLFATDNPLATFAGTRKALDEVTISESFKKKILGGNAERLLNL